MAGRAAGRTGVGVEASNSAGGPALKVLGRSQFDSAGVARVPGGQTTVAVRAPGVNAESVVVCTPHADPSRTAHWVDVHPGTGFSLHLTGKAPAGGLPFGYLVIESV